MILIIVNYLITRVLLKARLLHIINNLKIITNLPECLKIIVHPSLQSLLIYKKLWKEQRNRQAILILIVHK